MRTYKPLENKKLLLLGERTLRRGGLMGRSPASPKPSQSDFLNYVEVLFYNKNKI